MGWFSNSNDAAVAIIDKQNKEAEANRASQEKIARELATLKREEIQSKEKVELVKTENDTKLELERIISDRNIKSKLIMIQTSHVRRII